VIEMDLLREILAEVLKKENITVSFPDLSLSLSEILESESFAALQKIKAAIEDDSLSDFECVERIVGIFENIGSGGGNRHDF